MNKEIQPDTINLLWLGYAQYHHYRNITAHLIRFCVVKSFFSSSVVSGQNTLLYRRVIMYFSTWSITCSTDSEEAGEQRGIGSCLCRHLVVSSCSDSPRTCYREKIIVECYGGLCTDLCSDPSGGRPSSGRNPEHTQTARRHPGPDREEVNSSSTKRRSQSPHTYMPTHTFLLDMFTMKARHCFWISRPGFWRFFK